MHLRTDRPEIPRMVKRDQTERTLVFRREMQRSIFALLIASISLSALAQVPKNQETPKGCKVGNLYGSGDPATGTVTKFFADLRIAIKNGDKTRVAQLAHYPLLVSTRETEFTVHSQKQFVKQYDQILPANLQSFLLKQSPECVSRVGVKGFSIGSGQLWFDEYPDGRVRMFTINAIVYPGE